ncbi:Insulin receptor [Trichinella pseudospiralis]|uniref:Tyrosine-protein kinase receptor n=1 Tax=Trichinella pseudospiralis TaxID=6337 RepID=A0A0V1K5E4_TRIPS|nr:Insulin receptor [Trichinella pseudospiralis]KRZ42326.1 Insulin receptor [Trichinella pseudospiralis]
MATTTSCLFGRNVRVGGGLLLLMLWSSVVVVPLLLPLLAVPPCLATEEVVCSGFAMRNSPRQFYADLDDRMRLLHSKCTVVEGDVRLTLMTSQNLTDDDFRLVIMPNVREITGSILVFQVLGLRSLGSLFPNLRLIRGNSLVHNYALVLFQNPNLREIGLTNLVEISKGGVRIVNNPELCYAKTVAWEELCREQYAHVVIEGGKNANLCSEKCVGDDRLCLERSNGRACWNHDHCQLTCPVDCASQGLACNGTTTAGQKPFCCHRSCAGGCTGPADHQCMACRRVHHNGRCLDQCPDGLLELEQRRCVTRRQCRERRPVVDQRTGHSLLYKAVDAGRLCSLHCPAGYDEHPGDRRLCTPCAGACSKKCPGGDVRSLAEAAQFRGCDVVLGALDITMQGGLTKNVAGKLEEYLGNISEITDYLKVSFSPPLVSLNMLRNLRLIRGRKLWNNKYALSVFENQHLSMLWDFDDTTTGTRQLRIENGRLQFHNNPHLCYKTIVDLAVQVGLGDSLQDLDVSPMSNGDKAVCEELELEIECRFVGSDLVVIQWDSWNTSMMDHRMFLGYQLYYRPVEAGNVSIAENRDACHDSWKMMFFQTSERGAFVTDLQPYTRYAFYLATLMVNSPGARGGVSKVIYVRTAFGHPSPVLVTRAESLTPDSITVEWLPPVKPNGHVTHYMLSVLPKKRPLWSERNFCDEPPDYSSQTDRRKNSSSGQTGAGNGVCAQLKCCECQPSLWNQQQQQQLQLTNNSTGNNGNVSSPASALLDPELLVNEQKERALFENIIHNIVFVRNSRHRRHHGVQEEPVDLTLTSNNGSNNNGNSSNNNNNNNNKWLKPMVVNVSDRRYTVTGLHHFTTYEIRIWACQNRSVVENFCSRREALVVQSTRMVEWKDAIDESSVSVSNASAHSPYHLFVRWAAPAEPNGGTVVSYEVEYAREADPADSAAAKPKRECTTGADFAAVGGMHFRHLSAGNYSFRVRAVSLAQRGPWTRKFHFLIVDAPRQLDTSVLVVSVGCSLVLIGVGVVLAVALSRRHLKRMLPGYVQHVFSANPEYISQLEVYEPDEWELSRQDVQLLNELGRGSFGTVYAGRGRDVLSSCGVRFGDCAIKTVSQNGSVYDRWHFLVEASVMKKFNTAFVVKLYGVVSEGQPALVVMELMSNGNLRDYLRSRRPGSDGAGPAPSRVELYAWAAEIADGMAYLEAIRFCHRDLAARNCMVSASGCCKIGDFGMARDVYVKDYYRPRGRRLMPVRWMAPEALQDAKFTSKSDVWSYGVVLWEIATLASQPYAGLSNEQVFERVVERRQLLARPNDCPPGFYELMRLCWSANPRDRPSFSEIAFALCGHIPDHLLSGSFSESKMFLTNSNRRRSVSSELVDHHEQQQPSDDITTVQPAVQQQSFKTITPRLIPDRIFEMLVSGNALPEDEDGAEAEDHEEEEEEDDDDEDDDDQLERGKHLRINAGICRQSRTPAAIPPLFRPHRSWPQLNSLLY